MSIPAAIATSSLATLLLAQIDHKDNRLDFRIVPYANGSDTKRRMASLRSMNDLQFKSPMNVGKTSRSGNGEKIVGADWG